MNLLGGLFNFLGRTKPGWASVNWATELVWDLQIYLIVLFSVVGSAATAYAIFLGTLLAKAEDEGKRKEAKSRIFKTIAGLFIIVILASSFVGSPPWIVHLLGDVKNMDTETEGTAYSITIDDAESDSWINVGTVRMDL